MDKQIVATLESGWETKNMVNFVFDQDPKKSRHADVPNLYVRQTALKEAFGKFPKKIKVTVEAVEE